MIRTRFDTRQFTKDMNNIMDYSVGFLDGIHNGKSEFFKVMGLRVVEKLKNFIDSNAKANPEMLHHVYEWYKVGSPSSRLYEINYTVSNLGLSFISGFRQSSAIANGSSVPFYNKAFIMENGVAVTVSPKKSDVLAFEVDGEQVFTRNSVRIENPGGYATQGGFEKTFDLFFNKYFSQAFLRASGIAQYLEKPIAYKKSLPAGKRGGRPVGLSAGYRWIANAGVGA